MNMDLAEGLKFAETIDTYFKTKPSKAEVILCTPFIHLAGASEILRTARLPAEPRIVPLKPPEHLPVKFQRYDKKYRSTICHYWSFRKKNLLS